MKYILKKSQLLLLSGALKAPQLVPYTSNFCKQQDKQLSRIFWAGPEKLCSAKKPRIILLNRHWLMHAKCSLFRQCWPYILWNNDVKYSPEKYFEGNGCPETKTALFLMLRCISLWIGHTAYFLLTYQNILMKTCCNSANF